jgi:hypothetical protein
MMNKISLFLTVILFTLIFSGCDGLSVGYKDDSSILRGSGKVIIEQRELASFNRISIAISGNVTMKQGERETISIETDDNLQRYILTEVRNDTLFISFSKEVTNFQPSEPNRIFLDFKELEGLETSGSSDVKSDGLVGEYMAIKLGGSGDIEIERMKVDCLFVELSGSGSIHSEDVQTNTLGIALGGSGDVQIDILAAGEIDVEILGSGDVKLAGRAKEQKINIPGSGDYDAGDLQSEIGIIGMVATGRVTVWVQEHLSIRIYPGKGKVLFYGNPTLELAEVDLKNVRRIGGQ